MEKLPDELKEFQSEVQRAIGEDEHAKHINFSELTEEDQLLYGLYVKEKLGAQKIKDAVQSAPLKSSSAWFRGWLANRVGAQMLLKEQKERKARKEAQI